MGTWINHGKTFEYTCKNGLVPVHSSIVTCYNGTFNPGPPKCVPGMFVLFFFYECWWKSCIQIILIYFDVLISWLLFHFSVFWQAPCPSPPPYVENGIRLFIGQEHGRRARYICNNGFRLSGMNQSSPYLICDKGQWKGGNPACQECEYNLKSRQENKDPPLMFIIQWNKTA